MGTGVWQTYKWVFSDFVVIDRFSVKIGQPSGAVIVTY